MKSETDSRESDLRAVFFDLGGTLFSNRAVPKLTMPTLIEAGERLGSDAQPKDVAMAFIRASAEVHQDFVARAYYLHRDLFYASFQRFGEILDCSVTEAFMDWLYDAQRSAMVDHMRPRRDCHETLDRLRQKGLSLSIVSNIDNDYLDPFVENMGLAEFFDHCTSSEDARSCKPHSAFFELAMKKAGVRANEVLFVGDSLVHDIRGAQGVGMKAALIREEGGASHLDDPDAPVQPDHVVGSLAELLDIVN